MANRRWLLPLAALGAALLVLGCQTRAAPTAEQPGAGYRNLPPREIKALQEREDPFLLDVHVPKQGYLAGTDKRIPYTDVATRASELPADRNARIVVYCMSGRMSAIAAGDLVRLGYWNVVNLDGGMVAWKAAGYDVVPE